MFCTPGVVSRGTEGVGSRFQVLRCQTHFGRYRGHRVPFSCFARLDSFSTISRASGPIFMFCVPRLTFCGTKGVRSRFHVLRARTHFRQYRGRQLSFSCLVLPDSFSMVSRALAPVFKFSVPGLIFSGTEDVQSCFHVLRSMTCFLRCRVRRVPFSSFVRPDSFSAVPRATSSVFMFCAPGLVFGGNEGVGSRFHFRAPGHVFSDTEAVGSHFHIWRALTHFRRKRGCRVPFSSFARLGSFSAVPGVTCPVFMFCAPGLVFDGTEGVGSRFQVLCSRTIFRRYRGRWLPFSYFARPDSFSAVPRALGPVFKFCALELIFSGTEGVESRFHVLRALTRFSFSCFARPDSFSTETRVLGPVFKFCVPGLVFGGTAGIGCRFHVLFARTGFRRYRGRRLRFSAVPSASGHVFMSCAPGLIFGGLEGDESRFHVLRIGTSFWRYRRRWVTFCFFACSGSFSAVSRLPGPVFMICAPGVVSRVTEGVGSYFHVLHSRTHFRRYRGRRVPFSCFARSNSFSAVQRASAPVFLFCAP
jgi:hypothetical protein